MDGTPLRVLIVDDTIVYRKIVKDILTSQSDIEIVGTATDGEIALKKIKELKPDLLTLDLEMPNLDGLGVLERIKEENLSVGAIMISSLTHDGAQATIRSLKLGAFDFVAKPDGVSVEESAASFKNELLSKIQAYRHSLANQSAQTKIPKVAKDRQRRLPKFSIKPKNAPRVVCIGVSTGGPQSLGEVIPEIPGDFPLPILIVQHMPPKFTKSLAQDLNARSQLAVKEAENSEPIEAGYVYIAPGGQQMKVKNLMGTTRIRITDDPPENNCKPSVDYLFRSVAMEYNGNVIGVIMTGMGNDGTLGCKLLKRKEATIIAQNQQTCVVCGMPKGVIEEGLADIIAPLDEIAAKITELALQSAPA